MWSCRSWTTTRTPSGSGCCEECGSDLRGVRPIRLHLILRLGERSPCWVEDDHDVVAQVVVQATSQPFPAMECTREALHPQPGEARKIHAGVLVADELGDTLAMDDDCTSRRLVDDASNRSCCLCVPHTQRRLLTSCLGLNQDYHPFQGIDTRPTGCRYVVIS